ncbi:RNA helicase HrpA [Hamiltosporidium magnivora]|uniref:RNA helicase HrpA n=1 Tax=Hamiltosporidium magnivora TaxID=148818 RepID=A0A4Q9LDP9_9MICR|nr:RNA helicase HrpA [Hamiltosporidium magnivora]
MDEFEKIYRLIKLSEFIREHLNVDDKTLTEYILHLLENNNLSEIESKLEMELIIKLKNFYCEIINNKNNIKSLTDDRNIINISSIKINNNLPLFIRKIKERYLHLDLNYRKLNGKNEDFSDEFTINKFENQLFSNETKEITSKENDLPIFEKKYEIINAIKRNSVVIIEGSTGCGKTTQLPQFLLPYYNKIVCTQPRRIAAISVAKSVSQQLRTHLGELVGYKIRFKNVTSRKTRIKFVTEGILLREIKNKRFLENDIIILDETHERSLNIDLLISYFRNNQSSKIKLIIMSATLNSYKFSRFFNDCPIIQIFAQRFPIQTNFLKYSCENHINETAKTIIEIHKNTKDGDILAFLTGKNEIDDVFVYLNTELNNIAMEKDSQPIIFKLYSGISKEYQQNVFEKYDRRKIILSTNIAETSITIPDLTYVIDCGFVKQKKYYKCDILETVKISKAQAIQRSGRVGRCKEGFVYRLYTENEYNEFLDEPIPESLRCDFSEVIISLLWLGIRNIFEFEMIDKPINEKIFKALEELYWLNGIEELNQDSTDLYKKGEPQIKLTDTGNKMAEIPLNIKYSKILIIGELLGVFEEVLIICCMLNVQNIYEEIRKNDKNFAIFLKVKENFSDEKGDHFSYLKIYKKWAMTDFSREFCKTNFLNYFSLKNVQKMIDQIKNQFLKFHKNHNFDYEKTDKLKRCYGKDELIIYSISCGFFRNVCKRSNFSYTTLDDKNEYFIHPSSVLYSETPDLIIYLDIITSKKQYMINCLKITPDILFKSSNNFYCISNEIKPLFNNRKEDQNYLKKPKIVYNRHKF